MKRKEEILLFKVLENIMENQQEIAKGIAKHKDIKIITQKLIEDKTKK